MRDFNGGDRSGPRRDFGRRDGGGRGFGGGRDGGRREMHSAVCAKCGKECQIPFIPTDGRPVYCSDCFEKKDGGPQSGGPRSFQDRSDRGPRRDFERHDAPRPQAPANDQLDLISKKLDKILEVLTQAFVKEEKKTAVAPKEVAVVEEKKAKVIKKKPAKK